jgi:Arylsulfotransferase (ASST)
LLVSLRHLSTVLLFRPSTGAVVWHRTGPWLNQHNATFFGTHEIAVFDNHVVADVPGGFLSAEGRNHIVVMDLDTGMSREPFSGLLDRDRPATVTEGRFRLLADGGLYIEESDNGRHLRYGNGALMWSRVNDFDDSRIGNVAWSRYLTEGEVSDALGAIGSGCSGQRAATVALSR